MSKFKLISVQSDLPSVPTKDIDMLGTILPSVVAKRLYGVDRSELYHILHNHWHLTQEIINATLSNYYLKYWDNSHFQHKLYDSSNRLRDQGRVFNVIYPYQSPAELRKYVGQVALSFRNAHPEYQICPTVLVMPANHHPRKLRGLETS